MKDLKLCAAATTLAVVTATVSLTAAPQQVEAAGQGIPEGNPSDVAVLPAMGLVAAGGLVGAFALGVAQGYLEAKNGQQKGTTESPESLVDLDARELDYVLD